MLVVGDAHDAARPRPHRRARAGGRRVRPRRNGRAPRRRRHARAGGAARGAARRRTEPLRAGGRAAVRCGVVAVAAGDGHAAPLRAARRARRRGRLDAEPEHLRAARRHPRGRRADEVVVLPNSANVILAAERAAELSEKDVAVVESRWPQAGLACLVEHDPDRGLEENVQRLRERAGRDPDRRRRAGRARRQAGPLQRGRRGRLRRRADRCLGRRRGNAAARCSRRSPRDSELADLRARRRRPAGRRRRSSALAPAGRRARVPRRRPAALLVAAGRRVAAATPAPSPDSRPEHHSAPGRRGRSRPAPRRRVSHSWPPCRCARCRGPALLARPLTSLEGVGPAAARNAAKLGIETVGRPARAPAVRPPRLRAHARPVAELAIGEEATVAVRVRSCRVRPDPPAPADDPRVPGRRRHRAR